MADGSVRTAILAAFTSPDLTDDDHALIAEHLRDRYRRTNEHLLSGLNAERPASVTTVVGDQPVVHDADP